MRYGATGIALGTFFCGFLLACGGGGGGGGASGDIFSAQFFPIQLGGTVGGVSGAAFASDGELLIVGGGTDTIFGVSRSAGSVRNVATNVGGNQLLSIVASGDTLYAGDNMGEIHRVAAGGVSSLLVDTMAGAVTGLAIAPAGYGAFGGQIIASTENGGILAIDPGAPNPPTPIAGAGTTYSGLVFDGTTLYAVDYDNSEIDTVTAAGTVTDGFANGFTGPDGIALDAVNGQLFVADSGTDTLWSVSLPGGGMGTEIGAFDLDAGFFPTGLAFDGIGNLVVMTRNGMLVARGVGIPGYDTADFPETIQNSDSGFGGLALDRGGDLVGVVNDVAGDTNRVFRFRRSGGNEASITSNLGNPVAGELLLGVAVDPATSTTYVGSSFGIIYAVNAGGSSMFTATSLAPNESVNGLAFAPATFDAMRAGHLVAVTDRGRVLAFDLANPAMEDEIYDGTEVFSALAFTAGGTLYVADHANGEIVEISAGGVATTRATGLSGPDGLAIDAGGMRLLVAESGSDELSEVAIPGFGVGFLANVSLDAGDEPSGIVFDGLATALVLGDGVEATIRAFTVFP